MTISPHRLIRAFLQQPVDMTPIWIMRQAGRYLPEYRATREKAGSFTTLCKTPDLACEVTLQPLRRFALDGAIIFSDILTIPDAMGLELFFIEGEGPRFKKYIKTMADIRALPIPDPMQELNYVMQAIKLTKQELNNRVPLIGFSGSPWTLATYMIQGAKHLLYENPHGMHELLEKLAKSIVLYLNAQIEAGADAVMIFDTWGGTLTTPAYLEFSLAYMKRILSELTREKNGVKIPCILFTKNGHGWLNDIAQSGCDVIGVDWTINLGTAREIIAGRCALQGNMDPAILYTNPDCIRREAKIILESFGRHPGHVFNLGHGILPDIPPEHVSVLVDAVHELSQTHA